MTDYRNLVQDFAQRTRKNLVFIERAHRTAPKLEVYEVTQLVNSLLGLLVFPKEEYYRNIPATPLYELEAKGWPTVEVLQGKPPCTDLRELVRYLRNSIAHCNIEFIADPMTREIESVKLWNNRNGKKTWEVALTIEKLRETVLLFISLLEDIFQWTDKKVEPSYALPYREQTA